jgi:3-hydroxyacyl-[acyl-carrier protein] dehydratase/trans-2-decenoyl-[acyl-carrier protein] isomerase
MTTVSMDTSELMSCAYGQLLGENTPKLPKPPILAFDRVVELNTEGGKYGYGFAIATKRLSDIDWVFESHFDQDPVMPGTMMIEGLLQLAGLCGGFRGARGKGRAVRMDEIKFVGEVVPEDGEVTYRIDIKKDLKNHSLFVAEGTVSSGGFVRAVAGNLWVAIKPVEASATSNQELN